MLPLATPILFIVFNRPEETKKVFEEIRKVRPKYLFVAADAPRGDVRSDVSTCREVRHIFDQIDWDCEIKTRFLEKNLGCKLAVSSAIDWFFNQVESGIILEDDCLPSLSFFYFCKEMLDRFKNDNRIMQISGSCFIDTKKAFDCSYYFSRINDIWGWATWRRAWKCFDLEMRGYDAFKKERRIYHYIPSVETAQWLETYFDESFFLNSRVWSSQWSYAIAKENGLTIVPTVNLVENIGMKGLGVNSNIKSFEPYGHFTSKEMNGAIIHPQFVLPNNCADEKRFGLIKKTDPRLFFSHKLIQAIRKIKNGFSFLNRT
ncbi:hypothetical protein OAK75_00040 [Bacteriovoracales bacterium]|nr:hypothetical protein [Bacteriovoracales bacterium]